MLHGTPRLSLEQPDHLQTYGGVSPEPLTQHRSVPNEITSVAVQLGEREGQGTLEGVGCSPTQEGGGIAVREIFPNFLRRLCLVFLAVPGPLSWVSVRIGAFSSQGWYSFFHTAFSFCLSAAFSARKWVGSTHAPHGRGR